MYLDTDAPLLGQPRFEVMRLRFEVLNAQTQDIQLSPQLEFVPVTGGEFAAVPQGIATDVSFRAANEWIDDGQGGTRIGPTLVTQPSGSSTPESAHSMGVNPMPTLTVGPESTVVIEFSISATAAAIYEAEYAFLLTDAGTPLASVNLPVVRMEAQPPLEQTPGQRNGAPADSSGEPAGPMFLLGPTATSVHTAAYDLSGESCAACHRTHRALGADLSTAPTQLALCSSCHNGTDLPSISAEYLGIPANAPVSRDYYQHDPTVELGALGTANACADCHNPHDIDSDPGAETAAGWTPSERTYGASTSSGQRIGLEYQLCYKCHASPATMPSNLGQPLSRYALDKAVEFDPSAGSYHPIQQAGTNASTAMANSLNGYSPYKLWSTNFAPGSTLRCLHCHADARLADAAYAANDYLPTNANLPLHASTQRGILIAPYQDRVLNGPLDAYQAADFALCFTCHGDAPFLDTSGNVRSDTNFRYHGLHVAGTDLQNHGSDGTNIDLAGDGGGLATCAECHFRIHSTATAPGVYGQAAGSRLVLFAPNTSGGLTSVAWQMKTDVIAGSCSLKCHGQPHTAVEY